MGIHFGPYLGDWQLSLAPDFVVAANVFPSGMAAAGELLAGRVPETVRDLTNGGQGVVAAGTGVNVRLENNYRVNQADGTFARPGLWARYRYYVGPGDMTAHGFAVGVSSNLLARRVLIDLGVEYRNISIPGRETFALGVTAGLNLCTSARGQTRLGACINGSVWIGGSGLLPYFDIHLGLGAGFWFRLF